MKNHLLCLGAVLLSMQADALSLDAKLQRVIDTFQLKAVSCRVNEQLIDPQLIPIGEIIFNSPVLSGDKDTSCSTCHIDRLALTDGLPVSVGVGGQGESVDRVYSDGIVVPRNSFTLFGRAHKDYKIFFWNGVIQETNGRIISPVGEGYQLGYKSPLAVAATMPILARDEFLGRLKPFDENLNLRQINKAYYSDKLTAANNVIQQIIESDISNEADKLRTAMQKAGLSSLDLPTIGNALAAFIAKKVSLCEQSQWEKYIEGEQEAITEEQKEGALVFYGKGRCAACHNGPFFSDFQFHSIGVPQGEYGPYIHHQDIGRADVTFKAIDRFKFRTPPLIKVAETGPYGHNGEYKSLEDIVLFHANPIPYFVKRGWTSDEELLGYGKMLSARSPLLGYIEISGDNELRALIAFLETL
ncbi:methylamine utilization protein MauG [Hahella sp. CCB-MM4]|uniref:His-Xaa-Ser system-associated MauG-like protein n=1 Tax=Hahella sp. (strain CCB-MM4) TaxID=1926491 RepID=UPI000B9C6CEF|nr:His-Xaa-Ser system-associated MauG-like protein [Hahella sp. CCB-MM4]OZG70871.1 methylamine utilization protein MauG [Hahella sp. CCB-MM4]